MAAADPKLLTADELAAYRTFDSVTLFFARAEIEGSIGEDYTGPEIRMFFPELGPVVGYAVTSEWTTLDAESPDLSFLDYYEWITQQPAPRIVISKDVDLRAGRTASLGGMQARTLRKLGVAGVVSTIGIHKVSAVREAGMPVWSTGVAPAHGSYHLVRYGASVEVGRVTWQTGDLVFADENGAIRIPAPIARDVLRKAEDGLHREDSYNDVINAPDFTVAKLREWLAGHATIYPPVDEAMAERWWAKNGSRLAPRAEGISK
jgi:4-hydroxy-4-methyl-2-oxoglutarate aldolase